MLSISPAAKHEREAALRLVFRDAPDSLLADKLGRVEDMIRHGELDADAIWLARDSTGPAAALIAAPLVGGGAAIYPPRGRASLHRPQDVLDPMVRECLAWLRRKGVHIAQCYLSPDDAPLAAPLERCGFERLTRLIYLRHFLDLSFHEITRPDNLDYRTIDTVPTIVAEATLLKTYDGSLDCPELNRHRTATQALAGHRGPGKWDSAHWWLAHANGEPAGVLLCNSVDKDVWDISYLGVAKEHRGRGYGRDLVHHALFEAKADDALTVTLAVDERNHPARRLYRKAGFEPCEEKLVWMWVAGA